MSINIILPINAICLAFAVMAIQALYAFITSPNYDDPNICMRAKPHTNFLKWVVFLGIMHIFSAIIILILEQTQLESLKNYPAWATIVFSSLFIFLYIRYWVKTFVLDALVQYVHTTLENR